MSIRTDLDGRHACHHWAMDRQWRAHYANRGWSASFYSASRAQFVNVSLIVPTQEVVVIAGDFHSSGLCAIPTQWIDSSTLLAITEPLYVSMRTDSTPALTDRVLELVHGTTGLRWWVRYLCIDPGVIRVDFEFELDPSNGTVKSRTIRS